jgi:DNA-binding MarR family transcriptional regulator
MSEVTSGHADPATSLGTDPVGQADAAGRVEAVVQAVSCLWDRFGADVPDWAAQELTFGQVRLLFLLSKHGPSPMSRIAEWLGVGLPAASGTVERVERHGLVERRHRVDDRRIVECQLTLAGRGLLEEITGLHRNILRATLGVLRPDELSELGRLISLVVERSLNEVRPNLASPL